MLSSNNSSVCNDFVSEIQEQVTRFVFSEVSQQLEYIEQIDKTMKWQTHRQFSVPRSNFYRQQPLPSVPLPQQVVSSPSFMPFSPLIPPPDLHPVCETQPYVSGNLNYIAPGNTVTNARQSLEEGFTADSLSQGGISYDSARDMNIIPIQQKCNVRGTSHDVPDKSRNVHKPDTSINKTTSVGTSHIENDYYQALNLADFKAEGQPIFYRDSSEKRVHQFHKESTERSFLLFCLEAGDYSNG